ncbi:MAG: hypothetical protein ACO23H_18465, partial [Alphaproteobacteria bacterium]
MTDTLAEVLTAGNTTGGTSMVISSGDDVTFTGASANIVFDSSNSALEFADNAKAIFGAGSDLSIYHDGFNSYIDESGNGDIRIRSGNVYLDKYTGETMLHADADGAVTAYFDNAAKLATTSTGIDVTGVITTDGMTTSADINFGDNDKAIFGAGSDLQIYHDGNDSYVQDSGTGLLFIRGSSSVRIQGANGESSIDANENGAVNLYYDNSNKLSTTSTGIDVTGSVVSDGLTVEKTSSGANVSVASLQNDGSGANTKADLDFHAANTKYATISGGYGASAPELDIKVGNAPSIIAKFTETGVGIGTTSPGNFQLNINGSGDGGRQLKVEGPSNNGLMRFSNSESQDYSIGINSTSFIIYDDTADSYRMVVDSSGNVGIGNTSPSAPLAFGKTVYGAPSSENFYRIKFQDQGGIANDVGIGQPDVDSLAFNFTPTAGGHIAFFAGSSEKVRIDSSGRVGIGTTPDALLRVNGTAKIGEGAASNTAKLMVNTASGTAAGIQLFQDSVESWIIDNPASSTALTFANSGTERMRIDASGNLLVGTTSAYGTNVLNVDGGIAIDGRNASTPGLCEKGDVDTGIFWPAANSLSVATGGTERFNIDSSGNATVKAAGELRIRDDGTFIKEDQGLQIGNTSGTGTTRPIRFFTESAERMRIDSSGNVGIGTGGDNPTALLEVEAASNPEISIASSGGATSNFLNFKAISHSQQIQTQLKTVDNGDFTSDLAFLFKASGTSGALGEKARLAADGTFLIGCTGQTGDAPNSDGFLF